MRYQLNPPLIPRNGRTLMVLGVARISTIHQDEQSLEDQKALHRRWVQEHFDGTPEFKVFATRGSGERLDRQELFDIQREVDSRRYDLVLMEDLGRYLRGFEAMHFCGTCVDVRTRLIAINDHIDTEREGWDDNALFAAWRHKRYNEDTSRRIKQRLGNRFEHEGGVFQCPVYGYVKPPGCVSDEQVQKDPAATPVYDRWFALLENGASFAEVSDWLNANGVATGPYCRSKKWTGKMVARITFNPILKGQRQRNRMHTVKHHGSGRRRSVKAPADMIKTRHCPHLAHVEPDRYDRMIRLLKHLNVRYKRKPRDGQDALAGRPRKRTVWPGQHCYCGICKRMLVYGAHGQNDHLVCRGTTEHKCWNAVSFDARLGARKLVEKIRQEVEALPNFDEVFIEKLCRKLDSTRDSRAVKLEELARREAKLERDRRNVKATIRKCWPIATVVADLEQLGADEAALQVQRGELQRAAKEKVELPSAERMRAVLAEAFEKLALTSQEFARLMRKLIPRIIVYPHRMIDGGNPVLRAKFTLNLAALMPGGSVEGVDRLLTRELTVDLFDPPQREAYRERYLALAAESPQKKLYQIAQQDLKITATAVQRIAALARLMRARGVDDSYQPLTEPPADYNRLRRHKHPRYRFEPLTEFEDVGGGDDGEREAA